VKDETENQLLAYLHEQRVADVAGTIKHIANWTTSHEAKDDVRHEEIKGALRGHSLRLGALEKNDEKIDDALEKSGSWQMESVKAQSITAQETAKWWRDRVLAATGAILMAIFVGILTYVLKR
jgi:hypothetical protein